MPGMPDCVMLAAANAAARNMGLSNPALGGLTSGQLGSS